MNIIALNLPRDLTNEGLAELFTPYGNIISAQLVMDKERGTSKGFGFVEMQNDSEGQAAITALHGKKVGGNKIRVKISTKTV